VRWVTQPHDAAPGPRMIAIMMHPTFFLVCFAGPKLGSGQRWDLSGVVAPKQKVSWEAVEQELGRQSSSATLAYIEQIKAENASLKAGSDARCKKMFQKAMSGSEDADVDFVFHGAEYGWGVRGHREVLCAASKEYAGMFQSGMSEAQDGKVRVPPGIGVASFRGFLEWIYLGETRRNLV
jgi:hypothetical protein